MLRTHIEKEQAADALTLQGLLQNKIAGAGMVAEVDFCAWRSIPAEAPDGGEGEYIQHLQCMVLLEFGQRLQRVEVDGLS